MGTSVFIDERSGNSFSRLGARFVPDRRPLSRRVVHSLWGLLVRPSAIYPPVHPDQRTLTLPHTTPYTSLARSTSSPVHVFRNLSTSPDPGVTPPFYPNDDGSCRVGTSVETDSFPVRLSLREGRRPKDLLVLCRYQRSGKLFLRSE